MLDLCRIGISQNFGQPQVSWVLWQLTLPPPTSSVTASKVRPGAQSDSWSTPGINLGQWISRLLLENLPQQLLNLFPGHFVDLWS